MEHHYVIYELRHAEHPYRYIGSTTNFRRRKRAHKSVCDNPLTKEYHFTVYKTIREQGGWTKWEMHPLEEMRGTKLQARIREQAYLMKCKSEIESENDSVNMRSAYLSDEERKKQRRKANQKYRSSLEVRKKERDYS